MRLRPATSLTVAAVAAVGVLVAACANDEADRTDLPVVEGHDVVVVSTALAGPTQVLRGPDGRLWVAELNGGESEARGRVVALGEDGSVAQVLLDDLDKPTGIAVLDGHLWVMLRRSLARARIRDDGAVGPVEVVLDDLPSNGRSETSLSVADGRLRYATTGSGTRGGDGSGILWELDPTRATAPRPYATGFKNAYAHVALDGSVVTTEIGDGRYDGELPPDELVRVGPGDDGGWPRCIGDGVAVREHGGTAETCADTATPLAVFAPGATPTGLARFGGAWVVALWNRGRLVRVPLGGGGVVTFVDGLDRPQHLLVDRDRLLVTEHGTGRILALVPS